MKNIWEIHELMGLKEHESKPHGIETTDYKGTFCTGGFGDTLFDYAAGLLYVGIVSTVLKKEGGNFIYQPLIYISTVDDGVWHASTSHGMTLEESNKKVKEIAEAWIKEYKTVLPTEKELNDFLMPFGLWGLYTG